MRLRNLRVEAHSARIVGDLGVSAAMHVDGRFEATLPLSSLRALAADVGAVSAPPDMAGTLTASGEIRGRARDPAASFRLHGSGIAPASTADKGTVALDAEARYAGGRVTVEPLTLRSGDGQAVLQGASRSTAAGGAWDLRGDVRALDLGPLLAAVGVEGRGPLNGQLRRRGSVHEALGPRRPRRARGARGQPRAPRRLRLRHVRRRPTRGSPPPGRRRRRPRRGRGLVRHRHARHGGEGHRDGPRRSRACRSCRPRRGRSTGGSTRRSASRAQRTHRPATCERRWLGATYEGQLLPGLALVARADGRRLELTGSSTVAAAGEPPVAGDDARRESRLPPRRRLVRGRLARTPRGRRRGAADAGTARGVPRDARRDPRGARHVRRGPRRPRHSEAPLRRQGSRGQRQGAGARVDDRAVPDRGQPRGGNHHRPPTVKTKTIVARRGPLAPGRGAGGRRRGHAGAGRRLAYRRRPRADRGGPHVRPRRAGRSRPRRAAGDRTRKRAPPGSPRWTHGCAARSRPRTPRAPSASPTPAAASAACGSTRRR